MDKASGLLSSTPLLRPQKRKQPPVPVGRRARAPHAPGASRPLTQVPLLPRNPPLAPAVGGGVERGEDGGPPPGRVAGVALVLQNVDHRGLAGRLGSVGFRLELVRGGWWLELLIMSLRKACGSRRAVQTRNAPPHLHRRGPRPRPRPRPHQRAHASLHQPLQPAQRGGLPRQEDAGEQALAQLDAAGGRGVDAADDGLGWVGAWGWGGGLVGVGGCVRFVCVCAGECVKRER